MSAARRWRALAARARTALESRARLDGRPLDAGNAIVEFLGVALVLLVPLVYLVLVLGRLQAAAFAVDGAAREAIRAVLAAPAAPAGSLSAADPAAAADAAVRIALADQGFAESDVLELVCDPACDVPGAQVSARVELAVDLPLVPAFVRGAVPLTVPTSATSHGEVGVLEGAP